MIAVRRADERGRANFGWLDTRHTFSFGDYYDPRFLGFGPLRVINDDRIAGGGGFPMHGHADMEIVTYVLDGALQHRDSLGSGSIIRAGDVQRMTAGRGITHSEFNASSTEPVRLLQIWIMPQERGLEPSYEQKHFSDAEKRDRLRLVASRDGREGSIVIRQDVDLYAVVLSKGGMVRHSLGEGRIGWAQSARGEALLNGARIEEGDGAAIDGAQLIELSALEESEVLLFDMPTRKTSAHS